MKKNYNSQFQKFIKFFFPLFLILTVLTLSFFYAITKFDIIKLEERQKRIAVSQAEFINSSFVKTYRDLTFIAGELSSAEGLFSASDKINLPALTRLAKEFQSFLVAEDIYSFITVADSSGKEIIKIYTDDSGKIKITDQKKLNNIKDNSYFNTTINSSRNQVSVFHFNPATTIRGDRSFGNPLLIFAIPLFNGGDRPSGAVIVGYDFSFLIEEIKNINVSQVSYPLLINNAGDFLINHRSRFEKEVDITANTQLSVLKVDSGLWDIMHKNNNGQIYRKNGLYTFDSIYYPKVIQKYFSRDEKAIEDNELINGKQNSYLWKTISFVPRSKLSAIYLQPGIYISIFYFLTLLGFTFISRKLAVGSIQKSIAYNELLKNEELYRTLLEKTKVGTIIYEDRKIDYANKYFLTLLGITDSKVSGVRMKDIFSSPRDEKERKKYENFMSKKEVPASFDAVLVSHNLQKKIDVYLTLTVLNKCHPEILLISVIDISAKKVRERELEMRTVLLEKLANEKKDHLIQQLRHADRLSTLGTLSGTIFHDIKDPLASTLGFAQLARKTPDLPQETYSDLDKIISSCLYIRDLLKNILSLTRKSSITSSVNLNSIIRDNLYLLEAMSGRQGVEIICDLAPDLPVFEVESASISQVLINLVSNSVAAMPEGGKLHIITENSGPDNFIKLTIKDTGTGMAPEIKSQIFNPFFTTKGTGEGSGLGMSVVKGIIEQYNGKISFNSTPGAGTTFFIYFPVKNIS